MTNRLANESSPYLLQHAENPVDWYPWGNEALDRAAADDKPILLSIGYAACHWCHVMAHESFEDAGTAQLMNENFVNIKVDREERPDLDGIYMRAVQAMTGHGGWPMTVFLTPDGSPFYGGTYFPPADRQGMPSFRRVLQSVADAYRTKHNDISKSAAELLSIYADTNASAAESAGEMPSARLLDLAYRSMAQRYDVRHGGFDAAPKFPPTMSLDFLLRYWRRTDTDYALQMVVETFRAMARGGIYDQVGGGFARYSVDAVWLVPHFEKMLYDNALLVRLGAHLWQVSHDAEAERVVGETLTWLKREMTSPEGGFYSSLDADSEGHEGLFYLWDESELDALLGHDSAVFKQYYGVTSGGNFEGRNLLHVAGESEAAAARAGKSEAELFSLLGRAKTTLYETRARRVWPGRDDKIIASWNGLMLRGVATAARVFRNAEWREVALRNAEFLRSKMVAEGRVSRSHKDGVTRIAGFLEDHAAVALGFITVYELTFDPSWLDEARRIGAAMVRWFMDEASGLFYDTASDAETLITRPREITDNAMPSGSSMAIELLLYLAELFDDPVSRSHAEKSLRANAPMASRYPSGFGHMLGAMDMHVQGAVEVAVIAEAGSPDGAALLAELARTYVPSLVLVGGSPDNSGEIALLRDRGAIRGGAAAYVCRRYTCAAPITNAPALAAELESAGKALSRDTI